MASQSGNSWENSQNSGPSQETTDLEWMEALDAIPPPSEALSGTPATPTEGVEPTPANDGVGSFATSMTQNARGQFVLETNRLFLTWPRCDAPRRETAAGLQLLAARRSVSIRWALICQERHVDGTPHLHAAAVFSERFKLTGADCLDFVLPGFHPNIQHMRDVHRAARYVRKQDDQVLSIGTPPFGKEATKKQVLTIEKAAPRLNFFLFSF